MLANMGASVGIQREEFRSVDIAIVGRQCVVVEIRGAKTGTNGSSEIVVLMSFSKYDITALRTYAYVKHVNEL